MQWVGRRGTIGGDEGFGAARVALTGRDREMYRRRRISERTAKLLRPNMARTVKVGLGVKGMARKVRKERVRELRIKRGTGVLKLVISI